MTSGKAKRAVLIAGPTASGKTALAIERARTDNGVIVNADSMQVYGVLDRLTARPVAEELAAAEHFLFGHVDPATRYSTGAWLADVETLIHGGDLDGRTVIFAGGTGLYFEALTKGFATIPAVPQKAIQDAEKLIQGLDETGRMQMLVERDAETAHRIGVADPQRVVRALSVLIATGRPLSAYQDEMAGGLLAGYDLERIVLSPDRSVLRARIADRFAVMMDSGAVDEVKALVDRNLDPSLPAMKAIGVPQIAAMLNGDIGRDEAVDLAVTATRQYAKRQSSWFRNRMADWRFIDPFASAR